jgi:hypothetical protein
MTRMEFVKEANELCERTKKTTEARFNVANKWVPAESVPSPPLREKIIRFMVLQPTEALSRELHELGPSVEMDAKAESYADALGKDLQKARKAPLAVASGAAFVASDELAAELGLSQCTF